MSKPAGNPAPLSYPRPAGQVSASIGTGTLIAAALIVGAVYFYSGKKHRKAVRKQLWF